VQTSSLIFKHLISLREGFFFEPIDNAGANRLIGGSLLQLCWAHPSGRFHTAVIKVSGADSPPKVRILDRLRTDLGDDAVRDLSNLMGNKWKETGIDGNDLAAKASADTGSVDFAARRAVSQALGIMLCPIKITIQNQSPL
jgi:hypothetical protein